MYNYKTPCHRTWLRCIMLIQCDYQKDDFLVRNSTIYYQGVKVSPVNPTAILSAGTDELFVISGKFPLQCPWLVVIQSRFPSFYQCKEVDLKDKVTITLMNGKQMRITPYRDGACDRLLVNDIYTV